MSSRSMYLEGTASFQYSRKRPRFFFIICRKTHVILFLVVVVVVLGLLSDTVWNYLCVCVKESAQFMHLSKMEKKKECQGLKGIEVTQDNNCNEYEDGMINLR